MSQIRIETLDGKVLHRTRVRAQRLVDLGTHRWKENDSRTVEEIKPASTPQSDAHRFLRPELPIFEYDYPPDREPEKDPHYLPYTYPLPLHILEHYVRL